VGPRAGLDATDKRKSPDYSAIQPAAQPLHRLGYTGAYFSYSYLIQQAYNRAVQLGISLLTAKFPQNSPIGHAGRVSRMSLN
jgi:hypothetical protein